MMSLMYFFLSIKLQPPRTTLFPYTTLFRSVGQLECCGFISHVCSLGGAQARHGFLESALVPVAAPGDRSEEHTSELQSPCNLVCRLLLEKKKKTYYCKIYI